MEGKLLSRKTNQVHSPNMKPRVSTARPMIKSKTTAEIIRPVSGRPKEFYTLSRLMPNIIKEDKELLYEENMRLKAQSNEILEENLQLKTRIKKLENRKKKIEKKDPTMSLISSLKEKIKEQSEKISEKDEEIQSLRRNVKTCKVEESEIEIQALEEECKRLSNLLSEFMKQKDIPNSHLDYENRLYNKGKVINKLKKELLSAQDDLYHAKEEITNMKEKLHTLDKKHRKSSPKNQEVNYLKEEIEQLKDQNAQIFADFIKKEEDFRAEIRNLKETVEKDNQRYKSLEKDYEERQIKITILEKQMNYLKSQNYKSHEALIPKALIPNEEKSKHPPRLFVKIWQLAKEKNMLISVYLSLLDKNNNGAVEADELCKINLHGKFIKKKHVDEILKLMNNPSNTIPIRTLEQLIEKYEFESSYASSSEEEKVAPVKPKTEKLKFRAVNPDPKMNEFVIPQNYPAPQKFKEPEIPLIKAEELQTVFERIRLQMIEKMINKNRCVNLLFGNYLDPELMVNIPEVIDYLHSGGIYIGNDEETLKFGKFLIEPANVETLKESEYKVIKNKMNEFSKKLSKALPDWVIIDRYKHHSQVFPILSANKQKITLELQKNSHEPNDLIALDDFNHTLSQFGLIDASSLTHLYLLSFAHCKEVFKISIQGLFQELENLQRKILELKQKHERILRVITNQLDKNRTTFEIVFSYDKEILVNVENFAIALKSIEVASEDELVSDIKFGKYNCHLGLMKALLLS